MGLLASLSRGSTGQHLIDAREAFSGLSDLKPPATELDEEDANRCSPGLADEPRLSWGDFDSSHAGAKPVEVGDQLRLLRLILRSAQEREASHWRISLARGRPEAASSPSKPGEPLTSTTSGPSGVSSKSTPATSKP